ncbi:MAG: NAD(P)(+) transhydrogenase (Re/Si-specific) subunit beta, partial [Desulfamplus sp.]|nr:NAD(P)(+) transhydrogenase (Re/Si-specific) subunit beta [Desulfamplus sp.]
MCKAMNRNIVKVFLPDPPKTKDTATKPEYKVSAETVNNFLNITDSTESIKKDIESQTDEAVSEDASGKVSEQKSVSTNPFEKAASLLADAEKIIIIPGYGMAIAQAQMEVTALANRLVEMGKELKYAIHPVAGRMPGHMNVLLAEADVDYDMLIEMEEINPEFDSTDIALIVGACDVVNPAAIEVEGTPISGMPILMAQNAKNVICCNFDEKPGYSGVENPLYHRENTLMLCGNAKETVHQL